MDWFGIVGRASLLSLVLAFARLLEIIIVESNILYGVRYVNFTASTE